MWTLATRCCLHRSQPRSNEIIATERKFLHRFSVGCWHAQQAATLPSRRRECYELAPVLLNDSSSVPPQRPDDASRTVSKLARLDPTVCEQNLTEKRNAKISTICSRSRVDVHFCFGSDGPRYHSKTQSTIPGPTADWPRVRAILSATLDDLARASFPAHMGHASSCSVHIEGHERPRPCLQA